MSKKSQIMTIGIDAREALKSNRAGKGNYNYHLIDNLHKSQPLTIFLESNQSTSLPTTWAKSSNIQIVEIPASSLSWHKKVAKYIFDNQIQNYISPTSYITPYFIHKLSPKTNLIVTVHDLIVFLFPQGHALKPKLIERHYLKKLIHKTNCKFASVSNSTAKDLFKVFPNLKPERSFIAQNGINHQNYQVRPSQETSNTILSVSTVIPRKNFKTLIQAFSYLKDIIPHKLIIAGKHSPKNIKPLLKLTKKLNLQDRVEFTGFISDQDLLQLYQQADFVVIPSLYEGFGLPALESLAQGIPLICSNIPPFQEVTAGKALFFNPTNPVDLANQIKFLHNNQEQKHILSQEGPIQSQKFSWQKTAQAILKTLKSTPL